MNNTVKTKKLDNKLLVQVEDDLYLSIIKNDSELSSITVYDNSINKLARVYMQSGLNKKYFSNVLDIYKDRKDVINILNSLIIHYGIKNLKINKNY